MFKLKELTAETMSEKEEKGCKLLADSIAKQIQYLSALKGQNLSILIAQGCKELHGTSLTKGTMISILDTFITEVNENWNITDKTKLITVIVNSGNEELIKFQPSHNEVTKEEIRLSQSSHNEVTKEEIRLSQSFHDHIARRNSAEQSHKKLKASLVR